MAAGVVPGANGGAGGRCHAAVGLSLASAGQRRGAAMGDGLRSVKPAWCQYG
jgi:hypothetical protein